MISGNLLPIVSGHVGPIDDIESLRTAYDAGELTRFLADGCWWVAEADGAGQLIRLEHEPTADAARRAHCAKPDTVRDGGLLIIGPETAGMPSIHARMFPACEAAERLAAVGAPDAADNRLSAV